MKAISIRQPWAWLIVNDYKNIENRSWKDKFRGRTLIHASKKIDKEAIQWVTENFPDILLPEKFDTGGVIGSVDVIDCVSESDSPWFFGPFGFVLKNPVPCEFIPYKGQLRFFNTDLIFSIPDNR